MKHSVLLAACFSMTEALVTYRPAPRLPDGYGVHNEFAHPDTGAKIQMFVKGYTGSVHALDSSGATFIPTVHYRTPAERNLEDSLEERNVCEYVADCLATGVSEATIWAMEKGQLGAAVCVNLANGVSNYLTENNYAASKSIIAGSAVTVFWTLGLTPFQFYITAAMESKKGGSSSDACGETQPPTYAADTASGVYEWCLSIKNAKLAEQIATRFAAGDLAKTHDKDIAGAMAVTRMYLATIAPMFVDECAGLGITWRRSLADGDRGYDDRKAIEAF